MIEALPGRNWRYRVRSSPKRGGPGLRRGSRASNEVTLDLPLEVVRHPTTPKADQAGNLTFGLTRPRIGNRADDAGEPRR